MRSAARRSPSLQEPWSIAARRVTRSRSASWLRSPAGKMGQFTRAARAPSRAANFTFTLKSVTERVPLARRRVRSMRPVDADHEHYKWWALSTTSLGMLLAPINSGTLIIALPDLGRSLHTSLLQLVWVILAYMIASTVLVLTAGRLSDLFGRKRAYLLGFVIFAATSLGAGFAADGTELILWRIAQGIGGALIFANSSALVTDAFPREQLGVAMGTT